MPDSLKFFGCTVKSFGTSLGFGSQPSTVSVRLVRDFNGGDVFTPNPIGTPATVQYGSLHFTGLVRDYKQLASTDGLPVYEVNLEDPRSILEGTELILSDYNGTTQNVPNLINVYGYNENIGFGNSYSNESGMPWLVIVDTVTELVDSVLNGFVTPYGSALSYKGFLYGIDLTQMPMVPSYYRIPGPNISLLKAIEQVCADSACDFFVDFIPGTTVIRVRTVNRRLPPSLSVLSAFIDQQTLSGNCISSSKGLEMRNEPTSAFITGGRVSTLFESTVNYQYFGQNILNQPIVTYYRNPVVTQATGTLPITVVDENVTLDGSASAVDDFYNGSIIAIVAGTGAGEQRYIVDYNGTTKVATIDEVFSVSLDATSQYKIYTVEDPYGLRADLNCSEVADILGTNTYSCYISEMLCALMDIDRWESYIEEHRPDLEALFRGWTVPLRKQVGAINRGQFGICILNLTAQAMQQAARNVSSGLTQWQKERVYNWLLTTANNHLGKTFLAQIPIMFSAVEPETLRIIQSHEPTNAGWIEGGPVGIPLEKVDLLTTEDGRVLPYATYFQTRNIAARGVSIPGTHLSTEIYLNEPCSNFDNAYVGFIAEIIEGAGAGQTNTIATYSGPTQIATVTQAWTTPPNITSVIILYQRVANLDLSKINRRSDVIINGTTVHVKAQVEQGKVVMLNGITPCAVVTLSDAVWQLPSSDCGPPLGAIAIIFGNPQQTLVDTSRRGAGGAVRWKTATPACSPFSIQIPLQSNTLTYGPWYAIGAQGKVSFKSDSSLVPWNYGGSTVMDLTAQAMVNDAISWVNVVESGEVQLVGAPQLNLGDALQTIGPVCTNMNVSYGEDGIKTTYYFQTYSPRFGLFSFQNAQRLKQLGLANQRIAREIRTTLHDLRSTGRGIAEGTAYAYRTWNERNGFYSGHSPHPILVGDSQPDMRDSTNRRVEVALTSIGEVGQAWAADDDGPNSEFTTKASASLSSIFRPVYTRMVGINAANAAINLPEGVSAYTDMQMAAYWNATAMSNYTYAMRVSGTNSIDPFLDGNDIEIMLKGETYTDAHNNLGGSTGQNTQRILALRAPLVLSGWGWCTDDAWVPNSAPNTLAGTIVSGYAKKSHLWKTGPLEILWDDERGVWTGLGFCMGKTVGTCSANGGSTTLKLYESASTEVTGRKKARTIYNFMSSDVAADTKVFCMFNPDAKKWWIIAADC